jgi:hypothetical protein
MTQAAYSVERRTDPRRREIFDEAYARIEPFLDTSRTWGGSALNVLACHTLRQAYPELAPQDVHVLVNAARRVCMARRVRAARGEALPV